MRCLICIEKNMKDLKWLSTRWFFVNFMIACIYVGTGQLSDTLSILNSQASPIWAPSGIMVAAVLIFGNKVFPGILSGTIAINVWYFQKQEVRSYLPASIAFGIFSLVESISCAWLLTHPLCYRNGCFTWQVCLILVIGLIVYPDNINDLKLREPKFNPRHCTRLCAINQIQSPWALIIYCLVFF